MSTIQQVSLGDSPVQTPCGCPQAEADPAGLLNRIAYVVFAFVLLAGVVYAIVSLIGRARPWAAKESPLSVEMGQFWDTAEKTRGISKKSFRQDGHEFILVRVPVGQQIMPGLAGGYLLFSKTKLPAPLEKEIREKSSSSLQHIQDEDKFLRARVLAEMSV